MDPVTALFILLGLGVAYLVVDLLDNKKVDGSVFGNIIKFFRSKTGDPAVRIIPEAPASESRPKMTTAAFNVLLQFSPEQLQALLDLDPEMLTAVANFDPEQLQALMALDSATLNAMQALLQADIITRLEKLERRVPFAFAFSKYLYGKTPEDKRPVDMPKPPRNVD